MLPLFTYPLAFVGLLAVPALVAIYYLRNRFRPLPVSSLLLWSDERETAGGRQVDRLQIPGLLLLEILVAVLLVLALAGPQLLRVQSTRPLVVVLDDSYSMQAGTPSARDQAVTALLTELRQTPRQSVRLVLAGQKPGLLGDVARTPAAVQAILGDWTCRAPTADLAAAVGFATELAGEFGIVLVLTDHAPTSKLPERGRLVWRAVGQKVPNAAIVTATRSSRDGPDRVLLEVANLSAEPLTTTLQLDTNTPGPAQPLELAARAVHRLAVQLPPDTNTLVARLGADTLDVDNRVTLLPAPPRVVRVQVRMPANELRRLTEKAVLAARATQLVGVEPDVVFTDDLRDGADWVVRFIRDDKPEAFAGPFLLDKAHPLTDGLALNGVIWAVAREPALPGAPVVLAGAVPLLTDRDKGGGRREVRVRLAPELSTLTETPNWPVLVFNVIEWYANQAPGLRRPNVRLGDDMELRLAKLPDTGVVLLRPPSGEVRRVPVQDLRAVAKSEQLGVYTFAGPTGPVTCAVNALDAGESDLSACVAGKWGDWLDETALRLEYQDAAGPLLLAALAVLAVHLWLLRREVT
jgi:hypothetical protein